MRCPKCQKSTRVVDTIRYQDGKPTGAKARQRGRERGYPLIDLKDDCTLRRRRCADGHTHYTCETATELT